MSFLFPLAWWLAFLSLPVIAFYLLKTRQRRRLVSTLLFWNQIKPKIENSPLWRKLRRWLSLLLQLLILALIVAAIARPAFDWEKRDAQRIVAVLDTSASMEATGPSPSRRQLAADRLATMISRLRIQDEMALITAENPPRILSGWTSAKRTLRDALASAAPVPTGTDPLPSIALARELITLRENARIEIFSDAVWPASVQNVTELTVRGVDTHPPLNVGLTLFAIRRSPVSPGDWQLDAEIVSPVPFHGRLELLRDGQPMDLVDVDCGPDKPWRKSWRGNSETGAELEAILQPAAGDMLVADNRARCTLAPLKPIRVFVSGAPNPFLEAVLNSIPLVKWSRLLQFPLALPKDVELVITSGSDLPENIPTAAVLLLNPTKSGFWGERTGTLPESPITDIDENSPLLRHSGLGSVSIGEAGQWKSPPGAEIFASSIGHPLVFGQWDRAPRWMVIAFDPAKSDLVLRTAFPVIMGNLIQSLRDDDATDKSVALLPGRVESSLHPLATPAPDEARQPILPAFPGWWLVLLAGLGLLIGEWYVYSRRITD